MKLRKMLILGTVFSFLLAVPAFATQVYGATQGYSATQGYCVGTQKIDVYGSNKLGQTLDNTKSFVIVVCNGKGTMGVFGQLQCTNQAGKLLNVWVSMGGCSPMMVASLTPNVLGNGDFYGIMACSMTGSNQPVCCSTSSCSGPCNLVVTISNALGTTLYIAHASIQLECS